MAKQIYRVEGMHCKSCEILIEDSLEEIKQIKKAEVDLVNNRLEINSDYEITIEQLNRIFKSNGYKFYNLDDKEIRETKNKWWWVPAVGIIILFLILNKLGLASFLNINNQSSLLTFFVFGIIAGLSTCGALLSGIIISYPKKTLEILAGRIASYTILGIILGMIGQTISMVGLANWLIVIVSILMIIVALQMLQVKWALKIKTNLSKTVGKKIIGKKLPIIIGFLTVLLPCGFTLLTESVAMLSGNWMSSMLIMLVFVLGTSIPLFLVGLSSEKLIKNQKMMGLLILFFVAYTLNFQFRIFKPTQPSLENGGLKTENIAPDQVIKAEYTRLTGLSPYMITVKKGQRIRLEIDVKDNEYGCMSTILLPGLFENPQTLVAGKTLIMEFIAQKVGNYKFTCAMGVPHKGVVNVIE